MSISYIDEYGLTQEVTTYTEVTSADTSWGTAGTTTYYVVNANTSIENSVTVTGDVKLIVLDGVSLTVTAAADTGNAGICVTNTDPTATTGLNTFTVYGQTAGSGQLIATGDAGGAGIGGGAGVSGSHITLAGGTVVATGGTGAAGIGGGCTTSSTAIGHGTDIKVTGGTVIATGTGGAGIGGGYREAKDNITGGKGERITITGGVVDARSKVVYAGGTIDMHAGAGIGGGYGKDNAQGKDITISGGIVTAASEERGAGIGGGGYSCGVNVKITGGSVTATSVEGSAIGGGYERMAYTNNTVYVNTEVTLQAGASQAEASEIAHTTGTDIASTIKGMTYAEAYGKTVTVDFVDENGETLTLTGNYTLVSSGTSATWTEGYYVVGYDYNNDGVINAEDAAQGTNEFTITGGVTVSGNVRLVVADGFKLTVTGSTGVAGVNVTNADPETATNFFTVYGQTAGSGQLIATGGSNAAGIGGNDGASGSYIKLAGGTVVATGTTGGAGIGGGRGGTASNIEIYGGAVTATGGQYGAGIGGGNGGNGYDIVISGGSVNATGDVGAGIGGGRQKTGIGVRITGGVVTAQSTSGSALGEGDACNQTTQQSTEIYVDGDMELKAGASEEEVSFIGHTSGVNLASKLRGKQYAATKPISVSYVDEDGETQTLTGNYTLVADSDSAVTWTEGYYVVGADYNNDGVINAEDAAQGTNEFTITGGATVYGDVKLIVADGFKLTVTGSTGVAGVNVTNGDPEAATNFFTVYGQTAGSGQLIATGGVNAAGIGGNAGESGSHITLAGGTVVAKGGTGGAGVGGGRSVGTRGNGTNITITGGTVIATGDDGAGIGGGGFDSAVGGIGKTITIEGGVVVASSFNGAGIGGGRGKTASDNSDGEGITISGGMVSATSTGSGAGIGGGINGSGRSISITGGTVNAKGYRGAGIGGGRNKTGQTIAITGGVVTAKSGDGDAIGSGTGTTSTSSDITVDEDLALNAGASAENATAIWHTSTDDLSATLKGVKYAESSPVVPVGVSYVDENGETQTVSDGKYVSVTGNTSAVEWGNGAGTTTYYVVGADYNKDGVINAADAAFAKAQSPELQTNFTITGGVTVSGDVKLIVADGFSLTVTGSDDAAGVNVTNANPAATTGLNKFTVYGQSASSGQLIATGGANGGAGIGGNAGESGSHITIAGGTVVATGKSNGAGIGGGTGGAASNIYIYGGTVTAAGNASGAGIGGGLSGAASDIRIYGGVIDASSTARGAGIGSGQGANASGVYIYGGTVTANGATYGAGIGGGNGGNGTNIRISGGTVNATGGSGSGIGSGFNKKDASIWITGGVVTAQSTSGNALVRGAKVTGAGGTIYVDGNWELEAGASSEETSVIAHTSSENLATKLSGLKYASSQFETVTVAADSTVNATGGLTYQAVSGNAFTVEAGGVLNLAGGTVSTTFSGNTVAIQNAGTVNVQGAVTLATATDTIEGTGTINWDLTAGSTSNLDFSISDWSKVTATGAKTVTVASGTAQYGGSYALADNVSGDFAITLKGLGTDYALSLNGTSSVTTEDGTYYGLSKTAGTVSLLIAEETTVGGTATTYCGGTAARITGGTTTRMFIGGSKNGTTTGSCTVSITDGSLTKSLAAGDAASGQAVGQTGDLTLTIEGGTFGQRVAGGMYAADSAAVTELDGSVTLTIKGGTFTGRIYGGSNAQQDAYGQQTTIEGSVSTLVDSSTNKIVIQNYLIGGSRGAGRITGDVTVTFTGTGSNLSFGESSVVAGGSNADTVKIDAEGNRTTTSMVDGARNLVFDAFKGDFGADLRLFSTATFKNKSTVALTDTRVNLWTVETWNFEYGSSLTGLLANDFEGDRLNFDFKDWDGSTDWEVVTGDAKAFDDLNDAAAVYFGDSLASFDGVNNCWTDGTYKLSLGTDANSNTTMIVSKIA